MVACYQIVEKYNFSIQENLPESKQSSNQNTSSGSVLFSIYAFNPRNIDSPFTNLDPPTTLFIINFRSRPFPSLPRLVTDTHSPAIHRSRSSRRKEVKDGHGESNRPPNAYGNRDPRNGRRSSVARPSSSDRRKDSRSNSQTGRRRHSSSHSREKKHRSSSQNDPISNPSHDAAQERSTPSNKQPQRRKDSVNKIPNFFNILI